MDIKVIVQRAFKEGYIDLAYYKSKATAAKILHEIVRTCARREGQKPDIECWVNTPDTWKNYPDYGKNWRVMWEAGPYCWGVDLSCGEQPFKQYGITIDVKGAKWFLEPHYSFDVGFVD